MTVASLRARGGAGWLLVPLLVATALLIVVPAVMTLALAFLDYDGLTRPSWAGLGNFRRMIGDSIFRTALWNSILFAAIAVPLRVGAALGAALLYAPNRRGAGTYRALAYLPTVVPDVSYALLWLWFFNPLYGPLSIAMQAFGLPGTTWLLGPWGARVSIIVLTVYQIGEGFIVTLAARHDVPAELYELAEVEGAGAWWTFRRVTLPLLAPTLVLLAARDIAYSFQANFVPALLLTKGGPFYATTFLPLYTYQNAFEYFRFGYASAMTVVMYLLTAFAIGIQLLVVRRWRGAFRL